MKIEHNLPMINPKGLYGTNRSLSRSIDRLSSGIRINRSADDAEGLAISEKMGINFRALEASIKAAGDVFQQVTTAENALRSQHEYLNNALLLALQAASGGQDRSALASEFEYKMREIDRIAQSTQYNGKMLLDGSCIPKEEGGAPLCIEIGQSSEEAVEIPIGDMRLAALGLHNISLSEDTAENSAAAITATKEAIDMVTQTRALLGLLQSRLESALDNEERGIASLTKAESNLRARDYGAEINQFVPCDPLTKTSKQTLAQANQLPQSILQILG